MVCVVEGVTAESESTVGTELTIVPAITSGFSGPVVVLLRVDTEMVFVNPSEE